MSYEKHTFGKSISKFPAMIHSFFRVTRKLQVIAHSRLAEDNGFPHLNFVYII